MRAERHDYKELQQDVLSIIRANDGLRAGQIRGALGLGSDRIKAVNSVIGCLWRKNLIRKDGAGMETVYSKQIAGAANDVPKPKPVVTHPKPVATLSHVRTIEIPHATLKVLVTAIVDAELPTEGPLGKALFCAMKKLI